MSQFIDKLNRVLQALPHSMGFRAAKPVSEKPRMLLIASLARANIEGLADQVAGMDAGLLRIPEWSAGVEAFEKVSQTASDIPWGSWLGSIGEDEIKQMAQVGCDFVVFPPATTSLAILNDDNVGRILEVKESLTEGLLRAVNELPVDAVLVASEYEKESLTWHHLMFFQRCADLLIKPLLVTIPPDVSASELQALWAAGVSGVVVEVGAEQTAGRLGELRRVIDKLVFPSPRKRRKAEALLPHISTSKETDIATEEEEE